MPTRREAVAALAVASLMPGSVAQAAPRRRLTGMVWQPSSRTMRPRGDWHQLGIRHLLVQWTAVDNQSFVPGSGLPAIASELPDWSRIADEPWARDVVLGLAGLHDEASARAAVHTLAVQSNALVVAAAPLPLRVSGYYCPIEFDPTWRPSEHLRGVLDTLPRPLWVSVYDSANRGPQALADWIERWIPAHVGVFFQDGVGVHARTPAVAREYLRMLTDRLGLARVRVIAEAFRPAQAKGELRSATAAEFLPQIDAYQDWPIYAFDGPHYLQDALVADLLAAGVTAR